MIYLLKLVACSALFLVVYLFLLQREKMFGFNRIFLLTGLILPFFIPLMTFELRLSPEMILISGMEEQAPAFPAAGEVSGVGDRLEKVSESDLPPAPLKGIGSRDLLKKTPVSYLLIIYLLISGILVVRFARNLLILCRSIRAHERIPFRNATLVLLDKAVSPLSFMGYILVNKKTYLAGHIEEEILYHEHMHGRLYHSVDILLIELLQVFFWFNPVLYFYNRAIRLNHEFEVDEHVLKHYNDPQKYQYLLLSHAVAPTRGFCHSFNFIHLKNRIRMISARSNPLLIQLKTAFTLVFAGFTVFLFAEKTFAQQLNKTLPVVQSEEKENKPDAETDPEEFDKLASKALTHSTREKTYQFTPAETNRLGDLYSQMTEEEKANQKLTLRPKPEGLLKANPPSKEQFESFKDPKMYGVWLDGKRVQNHVLNNYKHTDFANFWQSGLTKTAAHYGQYKFHLSLSTPAAHMAYLEEEKKDTTRYTVWYKQDFYRQIREKTAPSNQQTAPEKTKSKQNTNGKTGAPADTSTTDGQEPENPDPSGTLTQNPLSSTLVKFGTPIAVTPDFTKFGAAFSPKYVPPLSKYRFHPGYLMVSDTVRDTPQKKSP